MSPVSLLAYIVSVISLAPPILILLLVVVDHVGSFLSSPVSWIRVPAFLDISFSISCPRLFDWFECFVSHPLPY